MTDSSSVANLKLILFEHWITLWRHKWIALAAAWVVCLAGWSAVMTMPRKYESNARAFVDVNGLLTPLLKGLIIDTNSDSTEFLRQTLLSRPNLEQVMHLAQLDTGKSQIEKEGMIAGLARTVSVQGQGRNLFTIAYTHSDPVVAASVVQSLLTIFAEKAASSSRVEMEKAKKFLDEQIAGYEQQLRAAEQRRADFRKKYADVLGDPISGAPKFQSVQTDLAQARLAYDQAVVSRDTLQALMDHIPRYRPGASSTTVSLDGRLITGSQAARIQVAKANLAALRTRFTDKHPDVISAQHELADLEAFADAPLAAPAATANNAATAAKPAPGAKPAAPPASDMAQGQDSEVNPSYEQLQLRLVENQVAIAATRERLKQATELFEKIRVATADVPDIDAKAKDVDRDYEIVKKNHDELLARRESATLSQAADDQADRTQFRIIDPPQVPLSPSSPNLPLMFSFVLFLGIGAGVALPIGFEFIRSTYSSPERLRGLGLPVIGSITFARRPGPSRLLMAGAAAALVSSIALLVVYSALVAYSGALRGIL